MHERNDEFMRQHDEFTYNAKCNVKNEKIITLIFFWLFSIINNLSWIYSKLVKIQEVNIKKLMSRLRFMDRTCFDILWQHVTTHMTGMQIVRAKMTSLDAIFVGETIASRAPALLLAFATEKIKNLLLALHAREQFELNFI